MKRKIEIEISDEAFCQLAVIAYFAGSRPEYVAVDVLENLRCGAAHADFLKNLRYVESQTSAPNDTPSVPNQKPEGENP